MSMLTKDDEFAIPFFKKNNFLRKLCKVCGSYFWTQDSERENCGDAPCQEYEFIGNPPTRTRYSLGEIREIFLSFFEENGHTIIKPYPIIARWRDDVYFVGASIYDFQPYVTDGILPPPANPLVVSQPCVRFTDIDNVGLTAGRHLAIFEMGGAHAFNLPEKDVYWKNDTIRLHHELLTKKLGVKSELVNYKEHFWSGGGNAGPDVEACVQGLEISTLVFMTYKIQGDKMIETPIKTVDTGYGMERWAWLSQGSPSGFHATYGRLLEDIMQLSGLKIEEKILVESAKLSARIGTEQGRLEMRREVARRLQMDPEELKKQLRLLESSYAVVDHTKALAFILAEGLVPSNTREGYLGRLLARRTYRMLEILGIENKLLDIVDMQVSYWSKDFPNIKEMRSEILEALSIEEKKYRRTLEKGRELVERISKEMKGKGVLEFPLQTMVELYDSHGLVPDIVKDIGENYGLAVEVPSNFFTMVAQRHASAEPVEEPALIKELKDKVIDYPATRLLYYEDSSMKSFRAKVLAAIDGKYVILDQTCFYSEGGGQPADTGAFKFENKSSKVLDAQKIGKVAVHVVVGETPRVGQTVEGEVDWSRRLSLMRHHTATHVLMGAARRVLGEHVWQAGAQKDVDRSRIDISHYEPLKEEELNAIEKLACEVIMRNVPVETQWMPREKAEQEYGFRLYQGGVVLGREIRVVKIADWEVEACGGIHCRQTGEVGLLKIVRADRIQDGVERIVFAAGSAALSFIQERQEILLKTADALQSPIEKVDEAAKGLAEEMDRLRKELEQTRSRLTQYEMEELLTKSKRIGEINFIGHKKTVGDENELIELGNKIVNKDPSATSVIILVKKNVRIVVTAGEKAVKAGANAGKLAEELAKIVGGGGGGKPNFGQGGGAKTEEADRAFRRAEELLLKLRK